MLQMLTLSYSLTFATAVPHPGLLLLLPLLLLQAVALLETQESHRK